MVNDNQIIDNARVLTHEATTLFIKDELKHNLPPNLYDLDQEFANTKTNKNRRISISLIIFTLTFLALAYFVTQYIEFKNSQIPISIDAFEDVNLREIFDKAKQHEKAMQDARRDLNDVLTSKEAKIIELTRNSEQAINLIETENPRDKIAKIKSIEAELNTNIQIEKGFWQTEENRIQTEISEIQDKIDSYDTRILEKAKEQENLINNQQKRFDMEMKESVTYFENKIEEIKADHSEQIHNLTRSNIEMVATIKKNNRLLIQNLENKYNPPIEENFEFIETVNIDSSKPEYFSANDIDNLLYTEGILTEDNVSMHLNKVKKAGEVFTRLEYIPYNNFPKQAITYLRESYNQSTKNFGYIINNITPLLAFKNSKITLMSSELEQIEYFLTTYVKTNRINGVIIDPRTDNIKVYIDPIYRVKEGTTGLIFRNDSDFLGTVKFSYINNELIAKEVQLADKKRNLQPFDMILMDLE